MQLVTVANVMALPEQRWHSQRHYCVYKVDILSKTDVFIRTKPDHAFCVSVKPLLPKLNANGMETCYYIQYISVSESVSILTLALMEGRIGQRRLLCVCVCVNGGEWHVLDDTYRCVKHNSKHINY
ncbi:hypothetical protein DPEC_G00103730 [Dallia pectoralis]|uniref:Uncharacterized protein n=1 Tax=Dallia pectoralis TaxID=75939 RepID=A0ACC2GXL7_DALPE|nr:hypothetical protein DPEC_G00103730 [Dallia pectoralis]